VAPAQLRPARGLAPQERPPEMREQRTPSILPALTHPQAPLGPAERSLRARLAAHAMHAKHDSRDTSAPGRAAFLARFEADVDPDGRLDPEERRRRAEHARSAYFTRLALASVAARRARRAGRPDGDNA
jgi:hypothetical protein